MCKEMWQKNLKNEKDDKKLLSLAMTVPLLPKTTIVEGCTVLLNEADDLSENHISFANEVRKSTKLI